MNTHSATYRILRRTLSELRVAIGASQLELFEITEHPSNDAAALITIAEDAPVAIGDAHTSEIPFAGYLLRVQSTDSLAPDALREIRIHHRLAGILLRGIHGGIDARPSVQSSPPGASGAGRMQAGFLTDTLLELLHLMDERAHKIANYVKIIELNDKILAANELYDVLQLVMDLATDAVGGDDAALLLVDPRTGEMTFKVVAESYDEISVTQPENSNSRKLEQIRIPAGQGIAGSVVLSARAEIIRDVSADPRSFQKVDRILGQTTRDMVVAPIVARGQVIGVIEVINSRARNGFLSEDLEMLQHIASHASLFIENMRGKEQLARVSQELDRKSHETTVLADLSALLRSGGGMALPADERHARFLRILGSGLRLHAAALLAVLPDQKTMREIARYSAPDSPLPAALEPAPTDQTWSEVSDLLLWILQNREPFRFAEPRRGPDALGSAPGIENRFRKANAAAMADPERAPGIWLPVFSDDLRQIDLVISLSGLEHAPPPGATAGELVFFRTIMNLGRVIFTLDA